MTQSDNARRVGQDAAQGQHTLSHSICRDLFVTHGPEAVRAYLYDMFTMGGRISHYQYSSLINSLA